MTVTWTTEQILSLAPDPASAKAGRGLANPRNWVSLGANERVLWGECNGSGIHPYQTQVDLAGPAFKCSCPSRKFPCKHGLALFLLYASQPQSFADSAPPDWVTNWLARREEKARPKERQPAVEEDASKQARREAAQARRATQRHERILAGLDELELWLCDLVRQGLAAAQSHPTRFWSDAATRLVDAQAPGLAHLVRELAGIPASGNGWPERLLERLGMIALLIESYRRLETFPASLQATIRTLVGWSQEQAELQAEAGLTDRWIVVGQQVEEDERLIVERTWLLGEESGRHALILDFSPQHQALRSTYVPGTSFTGELVFYPAAYPLRAIVRQRGVVSPAAAPGSAGYKTIEELLWAQAQALAQTPWIEQFPTLLGAVIPLRQGERWAVCDSAGDLLPLHISAAQGWTLLALSGGHPLILFGEWDGSRLTPLSAWADGGFVTLSSAQRG